jgi:predicted DNA-binding ribbon-helix-helix protein
MYENDVQRVKMHRTQIYFEESMFEALKKQANTLGVSLSSYIREVLERDLEQRNNTPRKPDFSSFAGMWEDREISQEHLRDKAWKK